jgi:hypothetical protein
MEGDGGRRDFSVYLGLSSGLGVLSSFVDRSTFQI